MRASVRRKASLCLGFLASVACATHIDIEQNEQSDEASPSVREESAIYGEDDRIDYYDVVNNEWRERMSQSIAALVDPQALGQNGDKITINSPSLGRSMRLCSDERFADQPALASCSATLIADDILITAAHCANTTVSVVFGYYMSDESTVAEVSKNDVYEIVSSNRIGSDVALLYLDRPTNRRVIQVRATPVDTGERLVVIGFPSGLPAKLDDGGRVVATTQTGFVANTDTFAGNSGSGVFDFSGSLIGILSAGARDYVRDGSCRRVNKITDCSQTDCESIMSGVDAVDTFCASSNALPEICENRPEADASTEVAPSAASVIVAPPTSLPAPTTARSGCQCRIVSVGEHSSRAAGWSAFVFAFALFFRRLARTKN